jgi:hypothetical protein
MFWCLTHRTLNSQARVSLRDKKTKRLLVDEALGNEGLFVWLCHKPVLVVGANRAGIWRMRSVITALVMLR